jgi:hypothetical protein
MATPREETFDNYWEDEEFVVILTKHEFVEQECIIKMCTHPDFVVSLVNNQDTPKKASLLRKIANVFNKLKQ